MTSHDNISKTAAILDPPSHFSKNLGKKLSKTNEEL